MKNTILKFDLLDKNICMETGLVIEATTALLQGEALLDNSMFADRQFLNYLIDNPIWLGVSGIVFFLWIIALIWAIKDASARKDGFLLPFIAALCVIVFTPIFGLLLYIAIRPQGWKRDKTSWRDTHFHNMQICDNCGSMNPIEHACCTECGECLQCVCRECQCKYSKSYSYCPNCGAPHLDV